MTMPKSSRKWRAARWALLVAGAVGAVAPASAQFRKVQHTPTPSVRAITTAHGSTMNLTEAQSLLEQVRVELAWLTDPATFPWPLTARATGAVLHVSGEVPNQAVRQQALRIAGANCGLSVLDGIKTNEALVRPFEGGSESLEKAAPAHLHKFLGEQAGNVQVSTRNNGQVIVTGAINSYEEKLAVSQSLRAVPGCTSVVNQLRVATVTRDGRPHAVVSLDGRLVVSDPSGSVAWPVHTAGHAASQESSRVQPVSAPEHSATPARESRFFTPFRIFNRFRNSPPPPAESPKPTSSLPPSMQSGAYRHLTGKTPAPAPSVITPVSASVPVGEPVGEVGRLQQRIRQVCGSAAEEVKVTVNGPKKIEIQVKVRQPGEAELLAGKILALPELVPYEVSMNMTADGK